MAEQIGRYEIIEELGRGGMATVYLAFDPRINRQVAIKALPPQFTHDPKFLDRFQIEAQTIAALEHPAIVPIHDFGDHQNTPYLVMRYMAGGSLRDRMRGDPLPLDEIIPALQRVAPALDFAHDRGIIHRDLKPANVLFDELDNPYLADFGIARLAEATHTMTVIGTPAYMSPEQVQGKEKLDGRSDIYALGIMLYELLTGEQPYVAETPTGQMMAHVLEPVPDILAANPQLPPAAQEIIDKAMAKDRNQRYASAAELVSAMARLTPSEAAETSEAVPVEPETTEQTELPETVLPQSPADDLVSDKTIVEPTPQTTREEEAEETAESSAVQEPALAPVFETTPPAVKDQGSRRMPAWIWWVGALLLIGAIALAVRSFMGENSFLSTAPGTAVSGEAASSDQPTAPAADIQEEAEEPPPEEMGPGEEEPPPDEDQFQVVGDAPVPPSSTFLERALVGEFEGATVSLLAPTTAEDRAGLRATLQLFEEVTGIAVDYNEADQFAEQLNAQIEAGEPPDIANIFRPALLAHYAREGYVVDLRGILPEERFPGSYTPAWVEAMTMEGPQGDPIVAGLLYRVVPGSIVWYPIAQFEEAGYQVPGNWDELLGLSEQIAADGRTPWCIGMEWGVQTGTIATDWIESIMLRTTSLENYDRWIYGDLPFASPEVAQSAELMSQIWLNEPFVFGGVPAITDIPWAESPGPMFDDPPGCWLHMQTPLIRRSFGDDLQPGEDYDFFVLPPIDEAFGTPLLTYGDWMVLFNDRPETRALMEFFSTGWSTEEWVRRGERISPNLDAELDLYPTPVDRKLAQVVLDAESVRFDASRMMPPEVGALPFWRGMTGYITGETSLETALFNIDDAWLELRGEGAQSEGDCHSDDVYCIGLVTAVGSIDDKAYNQSAWEGVLHAAEQIGAHADFIESNDTADYGQNIDILVEQGFDLIVTISFPMAEATTAAAARYPETHFIGVDQFQNELFDNLAGLIFKEDQAGFMAGALAAMLTRSGIVGAVFGSDIVEPVVAFKEGYESGARFINPDIGIISTYHPGDLGIAFSDPEWGAVTARQALDQGADVIFGAAGETGNGALIEVAAQEGAYCIGVDSDQWFGFPEARPCLVSSAMKLVTPGVTDLVIHAYEGQLPPGNTFGPVGLAPFHDFEDDISPEIKDELSAIHEGILNSSIETGYNRDG